MAGANNDDVHVNEMMTLSSGDKKDQTVNENTTLTGNYDVSSDEYIPQSQQATSPSQQATSPSQQATSPSQQTTPPSQQATSPSQQATSPSQQAAPPSQQDDYFLAKLAAVFSVAIPLGVFLAVMLRREPQGSDTNDCASRPCKNNGSCSMYNRDEGYRCTCQSGYAGTNCDYISRYGSTCISEPCKNGGSCVDYSYYTTCTCLQGYIGKNCEPACPIVNLTGWVKYGSSCYFFSENKTSITEAKTQCNISGACLADIEDIEENSFLAQYIKSKPRNEYYIGLNDIEQESNFSWFGSNRLLTGYKQWKFLEPNNLWGNEDCVVIEDDGYWSDVICDAPYRYICEIKY